MAHILNLIVRDGLKFQNYHVECVQRAIRYIRHSTQRISNFKKAMKDCGLETKKFLCGDTPTRWNSTFELLKTAYELREAFVEFGIKGIFLLFYFILDYIKDFFLLFYFF